MKIDWAVLQTTCRETILANWWEREYEKLPPETKYELELLTRRVGLGTKYLATPLWFWET